MTDESKFNDEINDGLVFYPVTTGDNGPNIEQVYACSNLHIYLITRVMSGWILTSWEISRYEEILSTFHSTYMQTQQAANYHYITVSQ